MFEVTTDLVDKNRIIKQSITREGLPLSYGKVLQLWAIDAEFRDFFISLLVNSDFDACRWESRPVTLSTIHRPYEFALVNATEFHSRSTDPVPFSEFFNAEGVDDGIVTFENLGGDATLIVPSPRTDQSAYGHLAAFVRLAPKKQTHALWRIIGETTRSQLGDKPIWLSTAGGGVAWLHVRLDSTPKYYCYSPFRFHSVASPEESK